MLADETTLTRRSVESFQVILVKRVFQQASPDMRAEV